MIAAPAGAYDLCSSTPADRSVRGAEALAGDRPLQAPPNVSRALALTPPAVPAGQRQNGEARRTAWGPWTRRNLSAAPPCTRLPATPRKRRDGPTNRYTFFLHLLRILSVAVAVGLLTTLAVGLEGGSHMIATASVHLAVVVGVAAGSRVEGREGSTRLGLEPLPYW